MYFRRMSLNTNPQGPLIQSADLNKKVAGTGFQSESVGFQLAYLTGSAANQFF